MAARAGLPLAATTYYFSSREDLLTEALRALADAWLTCAQDVVGALAPRIEDAPTLARAVVDVVVGGAGGDEGALLTMLERFLQAGRSPHLRVVVTAHGARLDALLLDVLRRGSPSADEHTVRQVLAVLDGTVLRALAEGEPAVPAATAAVVPLLTVEPAAAR